MNVNDYWISNARNINLTTLSVAGGFRDYQVRSGLTFLPKLSHQTSALSVVVTILKVLYSTIVDTEERQKGSGVSMLVNGGQVGGASVHASAHERMYEEIRMKTEVLKSRRVDASAEERKKDVRNLENQ